MDEGEGRKLIDILLIAGVALFGLGAMGAGAFVLKMGVAKATAPESVERRLLADPIDGPVFLTLKQHYSSEFAALRDEISKRLGEGADIGQLRGLTVSRLRQLMQAELGHLAQAPHAELVNMHRAELELLETLEEEPGQLCAVYVSRGIGPMDYVPPHVLERLATLGAARVRAAAAGRDHPARRANPAAISAADAGALVAAMRREGANDYDFQIWSSPSDFAGADPFRQCSIGGFLIRAVGKLPPDRADRVMAYLSLQKG